MFISSKRREDKHNEKTLKSVMKADPIFQDRLNNEHRILEDSISLLTTTKNLSTLTERYRVASLAFIRLNDMFLKIGDNSCVGLQEDIDALMISRLPEVVDIELDSVKSLKTEKGKRTRLDLIVHVLDRCDCVGGGCVYEAIQNELKKIFQYGQCENLDFNDQDYELTVPGPEEMIDSMISKVVDGARKKFVDSGEVTEEEFQEVFNKYITKK